MTIIVFFANAKNIQFGYTLDIARHNWRRVPLKYEQASQPRISKQKVVWHHGGGELTVVKPRVY